MNVLKVVVLGFRISQPLKNKLKERAKEQGLSLSDYSRSIFYKSIEAIDPELLSYINTKSNVTKNNN